MSNWYVPLSSNKHSDLKWQILLNHRFRAKVWLFLLIVKNCSYNTMFSSEKCQWKRSNWFVPFISWHISQNCQAGADIGGFLSWRLCEIPEVIQYLLEDADAKCLAYCCIPAWKVTAVACDTEVMRSGKTFGQPGKCGWELPAPLWPSCPT